MRITSLIIAMVTSTAVGQQSWENWEPALVTSTNMDGSVLRLEFITKEVIAGDRLFGRMVVSNASSVLRQMNYSLTKRKDSYIGDFVVTDDLGNRIPKTFWSSLEGAAMWGKSRIKQFPPNDYFAFDADLVRQYSLTNPGTYFVKAVAQVPMPLDVPEEVVIETPAVAITVVSRPEGTSPSEPLYTPAELARVPKNEEPPMMQVTPPRARTKSAPSDVQPQSGIRPPGVINAKVREPVPATGTGPNVRGDPSPPVNSSAASSRPRTVVYASIVFFALVLLGAILWRSRRSHS